jgi:hypothetical protein
MAKVKITGHASGTGVLTITAPNTSTDRTVTLPDSTGTLLDTTSGLDATKLSGTLPALNGASLTGIAGRKNLVINGAMQVAQRSASAVAQADSSNEGYATLDRWYLQFASACPGTVTTSQSTEAPAGFGSSIKLDCTSTGTPVDNSNDYIRLYQKIEGQNLQSLAWGTSSAKSITLSWYMKSTTYTDPISIHFLAFGTPANEYYNVSVTPTTSWAKYSITVPGSTSLTLPNTIGSGLSIGFTVAGPATPEHTQASNSTAWSTTVSNAVTDIGNLVSSTSNILYITGVQLELGSVATDFEHKSYDDELRNCMRYYERFISSGTVETLIGIGYAVSSSRVMGNYQYLVPKRTTPTGTRSAAGDFDCLRGSWVTATGFDFIANTLTSRLNFTGMSGLTNNAAAEIRTAAGTGKWFAFDAEI